MCIDDGAVGASVKGAVMSMKRDCLKLAGVAAAVLILVAAVATFTPIKPARAMGPGVGGVTSYNPGGGASLSGTNTWTGPQTFSNTVTITGANLLSSNWSAQFAQSVTAGGLYSTDSTNMTSATYGTINRWGTTYYTGFGAGISGVSAGVLEANSGTAGGACSIQYNTFTVATLPGTTKGRVASVSDALVPVIGNAVLGGGAAFALVVYNGAQWTVIGK